MNFNLIFYISIYFSTFLGLIQCMQKPSQENTTALPQMVGSWSEKGCESLSQGSMVKVLQFKKGEWGEEGMHYFKTNDCSGENLATQGRKFQYSLEKVEEALSGEISGKLKLKYPGLDASSYDQKEFAFSLNGKELNLAPLGSSTWKQGQKVSQKPPLEGPQKLKKRD